MTERDLDTLLKLINDAMVNELAESSNQIQDKIMRMDKLFHITYEHYKANLKHELDYVLDHYNKLDFPPLF